MERDREAARGVEGFDAEFAEALGPAAPGEGEAAPAAAPDDAAAYRVHLTQFEGPLDLLLYLIRKDEISIYDIPIARITGEYLEYLNLMKLLDLETAGEFLLMAATLIRIKARMLMPRDQEEEEDEAADPRKELERLLLQHQHFQQLGSELSELAERESRLFARPGERLEGEEEVEWREATLFDLLTSFRRMMARAPARAEYHVEREEITLEAMIEEIRERLQGKAPVLFWTLPRGEASRPELVVLFLAVLELARQGSLQLRQAAPFGEIWVGWRDIAPAA